MTDDHDTPRQWARSDRVYPDLVTLLGFAADRTTTAEAEGYPAGTTWETRRLTMPGWGSVIHSAVILPTGEVVHVDEQTLPVGHLVEQLNGLQWGRPAGWHWMLPQHAAELLTQRLHRMMTGLAVFVYQADPASWGGRWPGGDVVDAGWNNEADMPVCCPSQSLDLRDLDTY